MTSIILVQFPSFKNHLNIMIVTCGIMSFIVAMYWDSQDTERKSRKSDVAFWLHLMAAPLIVHPVFSILKIKDGNASIAAIILVIFMYVILSFVSIIIDRRALMVSALVYVIYAFAELFKAYGKISSGFAISGFIIGATLLFLSAVWHPIRSRLLKPLPEAIKIYLPDAK